MMKKKSEKKNQGRILDKEDRRRFLISAFNFFHKKFIENIFSDFFFKLFSIL